jgi:hypothetical protein
MKHQIFRLTRFVIKFRAHLAESKSTARAAQAWAYLLICPTWRSGSAWATYATADRNFPCIWSTTLL